MHKMLPAIETRNGNLRRGEGDLGRAAPEVERGEAVGQRSRRENVEKEVDGEPRVQTFVSRVHDLDQRRFRFEAGSSQGSFQLDDDCVRL